MILPRAVFSENYRYRYILRRSLGPGKLCLFIMLNPSTANETLNDPTVSKCLKFAQMWDFGQVEVANIFALRSTDPKELRYCDDPIGEKNNLYIWEAAQEADLIVCAWGNHGRYLDRSSQVVNLLKPLDKVLYCLDININGEPKHPLYIPYSKSLQIWKEDVTNQT